MVRLMTRKKKKTIEDERERRVELEDRTIDTSNLNTPFEFDTQKEKRRQKQNTVNISDVMSEVRDGMGLRMAMGRVWVGHAHTQPN